MSRYALQTATKEKDYPSCICESESGMFSALGQAQGTWQQPYGASSFSLWQQAGKLSFFISKIASGRVDRHDRPISNTLLLETDDSADKKAVGKLFAALLLNQVDEVQQFVERLAQAYIQGRPESNPKIPDVSLPFPVCGGFTQSLNNWYLASNMDARNYWAAQVDSLVADAEDFVIGRTDYGAAKITDSYSAIHGKIIFSETSIKPRTPSSTQDKPGKEKVLIYIGFLIAFLCIVLLICLGSGDGKTISVKADEPETSVPQDKATADPAKEDPVPADKPGAPEKKLSASQNVPSAVPAKEDSVRAVKDDSVKQ